MVYEHESIQGSFQIMISHPRRVSNASRHLAKCRNAFWAMATLGQGADFFSLKKKISYGNTRPRSRFFFRLKKKISYGNTRPRSRFFFSLKKNSYGSDRPRVKLYFNFILILNAFKNQFTLHCI